MISRLSSSLTGSLGLALAAGAAMVALQTSPAKAQFWGYGSGYGYGNDRPVYGRPWGAPPPAYSRGYDEDPLRRYEIVDLIRSNGWTILTPPARSGRVYTANVRTAYGQRMLVVLDAYDGRVLSSRILEERPDTNRLAAIPGEPDERVRPVRPESPTPAPRKRPAQVKRVEPPAAVKSTPVAPIATAKPTATQPSGKHVVPQPSTVTAPDSAPMVRQVYPDSGAPPAPVPAPAAAVEPSAPPASAPAPVPAPAATPEAQAPAPTPAPAQAAAVTPAPQPVAPAPVAPPVAPAPAAKPAPKLPADAGYE